MLAPLVGPLTHYYRFRDISTVSLAITIYLAFYGFCQLPIGYLSDRVPRRRLLGAGALITGSALALVPLLPGAWALFAGCAVAGMGGATYHPTAAVYLSDLYPEARGRAMGISGIGATVGLFFGPVIGGALCDAYDWRAAFFLFAAVNIIIGFVFLSFAEEPIAACENAINGDNGEGWSRTLILFLIAAACIFAFREFAGWGGYYLVPQFCVIVYGMPVGMAGFVGGLQSFGGFVSQPLGGWLSDKFGRRRLLSWMLFVTAVSMAAMPFLGRSGIMAAAVIYGVAYCATVPILDALIADHTPARIRGAVFGYFMAAGIGFGSFSNYVLAKIIVATGSTHQSFVICFLMLAASITLSVGFVSLSKRFIHARQ